VVGELEECGVAGFPASLPFRPVVWDSPDIISLKLYIPAVGAAVQHPRNVYVCVLATRVAYQALKRNVTTRDLGMNEYSPNVEVTINSG